ncbi:MAG: hypothetical protein ACJ8AW_00740, partial [Rhodopila sp.]
MQMTFASQFTLFDVEPRRLEPELRRDAPPGAERLLNAMVRRGLDPAALPAAALICLALEEAGAD